MKRRCGTCGESLGPGVPTQARYCSEACRRSAHSKAAKAKRQQLADEGRCRQCGRRRDSTSKAFCRRCLKAKMDDNASRRHTPKGWSWWAVYLARRRAAELRVPFALDRDDLMPLPQKCPVLGLTLDYSKKASRGARDVSPTLDRVVDSKGYVRGNVRVISHRANRIKNNGTLEEHRAIVKYLERESHRQRIRD